MSPFELERLGEDWGEALLIHLEAKGRAAQLHAALSRS
jgi:hypothetical protein